ncbi:YrhK family protein [Cellulomonas alba]|uniref:YrhK family protein n=1 Tax=Cellulomonas alba TaxID=3053467 RepID=A0ABT7SF45_9CELL|nr:YrhK family protein [Cellulomonas alba]MDM7854816.1 YrhK family protein [Cellulomonas alba]
MTRTGAGTDAPGNGPGAPGTGPGGQGSGPGERGTGRTAPFADLPDGWRLVRARGPGRFVTHALLEGPGGARLEWTSRRHRKGLGLRATDGPANDAGPAVATTHGTRRVARPTAGSVWLGLLFGVGSVLFALGSVPAFFDHVAAVAVAWTFFAGSVFFTSAGALQHVETLRAPGGVLDDRLPGRLATLLRWHPHRIDFWASFVQLVGTVCFNVSTFAATRTGLDAAAARHLVWAPDVYGSVCFLVASWLAYAEVNRGALPRPDRSWGWWIAGLNLVGSIAFGAAAVGARYVGDTADPANVSLVNLGTFAGAVCFLLGAALLPVESARDRATTGP